MSCLTLQGISSALCTGSIGGIKKVVISEFNDFDITTVADGEITAMTSSSTPYGYEFLRDNSSWTEAIVGDGILANVSFTPAVNLIFRRMSVTLRNEIMELTKGFVVVFITDNNGITWAIGTDKGMTLGASTGGQSGMAMSEMNGETLAFTGAESYKAYEVDLTAVGEPWLSLLS